MNRAWLGVLAVMTFAVNSNDAHGAFFNGATIAVNYDHKTSIPSPDVIITTGVTVGQGVELPGFGKNPNPTLPPFEDLFSIDISDTDILITWLVDQPENIQDILGFIDVPQNVPVISGVFLDPTSTIPGFTQNRLGYGPNGVSVTFTVAGALAGQFVLVHVTPEPSTAVLAAATAVLSLRRRRRK